LRAFSPAPGPHTPLENSQAVAKTPALIDTINSRIIPRGLALGLAKCGRRSCELCEAPFHGVLFLEYLDFFLRILDFFLNFFLFLFPFSFFQKKEGNNDTEIILLKRHIQILLFWLRGTLPRGVCQITIVKS
jgi:hypothetical protein